MNNSLPENFLQHRLLGQPTRADWLSDQSRYETKYFLKFSKISLISLQTPVSSKIEFSKLLVQVYFHHMR